MKQKFLSLGITLIFLIGFNSMYGQGVTTGGLNGKITDMQGEELLGATVVAIHVPTGSKYGNVTDMSGVYRIPNMRAGGPYKVMITFIGFESYERENVFIQLGQTLKLDAILSESSTHLEEIIVSVNQNAVFDGNKTGSETTIDQRQIANIPSASRSIRDFVRTTPQMQITEDSDGFSISIAGQNNRYNAIYIDGAINNDVFGLAGSGTNGGQTGVNPFSVDAIEQFQVSVAPFDVRVSGFSGGAINAITRSGSNEVNASLYYYVRNAGLSGKTPRDLRVNGVSEKLGDFTAKTYGFRIGGPIVKDKAFFFVNYEKQDEQAPQPFNVQNYIGNSNAVQLDGLRTHVINEYNYDIGEYEDRNRTLKSDKLTAKFDFNLGDNHKLSLKHSYVTADNLEVRSSSINNIGFSNGSERFNTTTNSSSLELSSNFGANIANKLIVGYTRVSDDRDPDGELFPSIYIADGLSTDASDGEGISFGAEPFSTANLLEQDIFTVTNNFDIFKENHTLTFGMHHEFSKVLNLFQAFNYGNWEYGSIDDFVTGQEPFIYQRGYSLLTNDVGDESTGAADFSMYQLGLYVQDEYYATPNLKLSAGLRVDLPFWAQSDSNDDFNSRTIPLLEAAGKDLLDAQVGKKVKTSPHISPRFGFNWNVDGQNRTQVRGGIGVFTSRVPLVWPGGTYNNNGVNNGFNFRAAFNNDNDNPLDDNNVLFNADVNNQPVGADPGSGAREGNIDIFAPDFKLPSVLKLNLAIDQKLPIWGLIGTVDAIYNKNLNAIYYQNLNVRNTTDRLSGTGDNRLRYNRSDAIDDTYGRIILASNTSEGYSWNTAVTLRKPFTNGFSGSASYSYGDARTTFEGTSSQNSSQWRNHHTANGKNSVIPVTRSNFSQGHRLISSISYTKTWTPGIESTFSFFYEMTQDVPVTYVYREGTDVLNDDSRDNALIYVPLNQSDIIFEEGANGLTAQEQWNALDAFIESNDYLRNRRGRYAERNGDRGPWRHTLDFKFIQEFALVTSRFQFSLDIFNVLNLLNKNWGQLNFVDNFGEVALLETERVAPLLGDGTFVPVYSFDPSIVENGISTVDDFGLQSSRWQMQVGIRYILGK